MSDLENSSTCSNVDEFNEHFDANRFNVFNALHLNISSLSYNIDQLSTILNTLKVKFDILSITESRLRTDKQAINNIDLEGYVIESTPTATSCGGALLYINKNINFKIRNDLKIYKYKELEPVFIEINRKGKNAIVGCIYRHPCMEVTELNYVFLQNILEKLSDENTEIIIMGDFNNDILKYDTNSNSAMFLDNMSENLLLPYIILHTRVTLGSQTLIGNIFSNIIEKDIISGNITTTTSDHSMQFVLFKNKTKSKINIKRLILLETINH